MIFYAFLAGFIPNLQKLQKVRKIQKFEKPYISICIDSPTITFGPPMGPPMRLRVLEAGVLEAHGSLRPMGPRSMIYVLYTWKYVVFHDIFDSGIDLSEFYG